jgi:hypothetical protein
MSVPSLFLCLSTAGKMRRSSQTTISRFAAAMQCCSTASCSGDLPAASAIWRACASWTRSTCSVINKSSSLTSRASTLCLCSETAKCSACCPAWFCCTRRLNTGPVAAIKALAASLLCAATAVWSGVLPLHVFAIASAPCRTSSAIVSKLLGGGYCLKLLHSMWRAELPQLPASAASRCGWLKS